MDTLRMTESELARDLHAVLLKIQEGVEVVIEQDARPIASLKRVEPKVRSISESIAIAEERERSRGYAVIIDEEFASDIAEIVADRKPWKPVEWD